MLNRDEGPGIAATQVQLINRMGLGKTTSLTLPTFRQQAELVAT